MSSVYQLFFLTTMKLRLTVLLFFLACINLSYTQNTIYSQNNNTINKKRLGEVMITESALYAISITGLYHLWYSNYPHSKFHFFNDNAEWLQMDKCGHMTTSYYVGNLGYEALRWSGVNNTKSTWYGGTLGLLFLTTIEILDGFSSEWGFSPGDMTANTLGSGLFISQQLAWKEQRILIRWSYHPTEYQQYRPDELGRNNTESWLKDYNGQTYWLSFNIKSFLPGRSNFPAWVNMDFGYGAEGMLGGRDNPAVYKNITLPKFQRTRKFFFSPDIDLTHIPTNSSSSRLELNTIEFLKFPLPAAEINSLNKVKFYYIYF